MEPGKFSKVAASPGSANWDVLVARMSGLYTRPGDIRTPFARDYTRILHCMAYRRLKHKTQVFFATGNDHICTRIEHVSHVASISHTIAVYLGLNAELTEAIAIGHDLGHPPFGHVGEEILSKLELDRPTERFWHEKNSLWFVDRLETVRDDKGLHGNLDLTYAVRDGIVCHCGEVDEKAIVPREDAIDLDSIHKPGEVEPCTWEGCVVKITDKIAFLGRDIEDAVTLGVLTPEQVAEAGRTASEITGGGTWAGGITNAELIHHLVIDLCDHSDPAEGLRFSPPYVDLLRQIRAFSYDNIYNHPRLAYFKRYAQVVLGSIFDKLRAAYQGRETLRVVRGWEKQFPQLAETFSEWLVKYTDLAPEEREKRGFANALVYSVEDLADYQKAAIDYIAGMTDQFAIKVFDELIRF